MAGLDAIRERVMTGFRRLYGSNPLHLIGHLAVFFVAGWAIDQIVGGGTIVNWIAWFLGAALLHDLVLLPLYSVLDRLLGRGSRGRSRPARAPAVNHFRVPAVISGILLLVYFPRDPRLFEHELPQRHRPFAGRLHPQLAPHHRWPVCRIGPHLRSTEHETSSALTAARP